MDTKNRKPFDEAVVPIMDEAAEGRIVGAATFVHVLLLTSTIPKNHDAIIESWKRLAERANLSEQATEHVVTSLLEQKRLAAEKRATVEALNKIAEAESSAAVGQSTPRYPGYSE